MHIALNMIKARTLTLLEVLQHSEQIRFSSDIRKTSNIEVSNRSLEGRVHIDQVLDKNVSNNHLTISVLVEWNTTAALAQDLQHKILVHNQ